nr:pre-mRNA-splicing factor 38-like [Aedes albopictus]
MAKRTVPVKDNKNIHGTNPLCLTEKIIRSHIYDSKYWKEKCCALAAEWLADKVMDVRLLGGVFGGNIKPTSFLCITVKMLQIQPENRGGVHRKRIVQVGNHPDQGCRWQADCSESRE